MKEENGVILKMYVYEDEDFFWVLNVEAVQRDVAEPVDPHYNYATIMENIKKKWLPSELKVSLPPYLGIGKLQSGRLQIGSELDVTIMKDNKMPKGWFFIRAEHRQCIFKEMEQKLGELKRKIII